MGSGSTGSTDSTGSFVILVLGFAFAFVFVLTGLTSSSAIVSITAS